MAKKKVEWRTRRNSKDHLGLASETIDLQLEGRGMIKTKTELKVVHDFYDVTEAAIYMKFSKGTVYQLIHNKERTKIPVRYNGRKPVFFIDELRQWMLQRTTSL